MKITLDPKDLSAAASAAARALPDRSAIPVMTGMLLHAEDGLLTVTASDWDTTVHTTVPARVITPGKVLVPGRLLADITRPALAGLGSHGPRRGRSPRRHCGSADRPLLDQPH